MAKKQSLEELLKHYSSFYPDEQIPQDIPNEKLKMALLNSNGRRLVFVEQNKEYSVYYEDNPDESKVIPNWNKLIGCGG